MNTLSSHLKIMINTVSRQKQLASICFKEEKIMKKKLAMVLTGVAVCGLLMVACQGKDKGTVSDGVQTEGVDSAAEATPEATEPEAQPTPEATEPEAAPEDGESGDETAPETGEAENAGETEGEDEEASADTELKAGTEGEESNADTDNAEGEEPEAEGSEETETKAD